MRKHMVKNVDWIVDGKSVQWSQSAAEAAAKKTGAIIPNGHQKPLLHSPVSEEPPPQETFTVLKTMVNPHMLLVTPKNGSEGRETTVRVQNNRNFRPGMEVTALHRNNCWWLIGRCPRYPGKW
jgi:hypothetical protein